MLEKRLASKTAHEATRLIGDTAEALGAQELEPYDLLEPARLIEAFRAMRSMGARQRQEARGSIILTTGAMLDTEPPPDMFDLVESVIEMRAHLKALGIMG